MEPYETYTKGDRVVFRVDGQGEEFKGTVAEDSDGGFVTLTLDDELHGFTEWYVHHTEVTKTDYVSLDTLLEGE